jgi:hypothetical protein
VEVESTRRVSTVPSGPFVRPSRSLWCIAQDLRAGHGVVGDDLSSTLRAEAPKLQSQDSAFKADVTKRDRRIVSKTRKRYGADSLHRSVNVDLSSVAQRCDRQM